MVQSQQPLQNILVAQVMRPAVSIEHRTELGKQDGLIADFDERLWHSLLDFATVYEEEDVRFTFKDGTEIQA